ncbi:MULTISPECIES: hypothetical protein [Rhizobium]|uniref:Uncharacterized protein n=1 Tax=Rhizobium favelukesii TaxID=348824 RepID=W6S2S2_9HYPH|nr:MULTISPECIES: hypothetical protein [Rhizobium]MCA0807150.1 hypothetical protein [Rhizobium sp. T1473]MCS0460259.1 hypothetical protein [Rhizobium favelukesii]UFS85425.1 hypothetical protein LPB79_34290 [Rhizobium sp. T136]CDM60696.1 hypothetical protein LPU83_pLPU83c_0134 [Rhizobium favelukesii]
MWWRRIFQFALAEQIAWAKMLNAGQICTNVGYLLQPETAGMPSPKPRAMIVELA